ncbi:unnamed protein product [Lactuca saligna]|uniref:Eukaryotic translation initiation factor 3 subunit G N-terminal domain-containing protein n=1 Tax=Lactuca saligna TaxID=75948 RepID=A0AA36EN35_LACSI|nr:unnamed protein product [Lactuca saligna]
MAQKPRWGELEEEADGGDYDDLLPPKQITTTTRIHKIANARLSKRAMERCSWPKFGDAVQEDVGAKLTMVSTEEIIFEQPRAPALLKKQGAFAKGQTKTAPVEEEVPPLLGENGKIEEDQKTAVQQTTSMFNSIKCKPVQSGVPVKFSREGKESLAFWLALGGKQSYSSSKVTQEIIREPHLFEVISNKGKLEIEEIHSFEQDDLFPEDVLILAT